MACAMRLVVTYRLFGRVEHDAEAVGKPASASSSRALWGLHSGRVIVGHSRDRVRDEAGPPAREPFITRFRRSPAR